MVVVKEEEGFGCFVEVVFLRASFLRASFGIANSENRENTLDDDSLKMMIHE